MLEMSMGHALNSQIMGTLIHFTIWAKNHRMLRDRRAFAERFGEDKLYWVAECRNAKAALDLSSESVKLSTVESAKGIEFRVVFIVGMEMLPRKDRDEASERRLAYVGLTRAQDALYVLGNENKGFFAEIVNISGNGRGDAAKAGRP